MLVNKTSGKKILGNVKIAKTFFQKFKGLMLVKEFDYALVFVLEKESRIEASIHMLFMRTAIDVAFLDKKKRVVDLKKGLKPWALNYTPKRKAAFIVEMPEGTIEGKIRINDCLEWE